MISGIFPGSSTPHPLFSFTPPFIRIKLKPFTLFPLPPPFPPSSLFFSSFRNGSEAISPLFSLAPPSVLMRRTGRLFFFFFFFFFFFDPSVHFFSRIEVNSKRSALPVAELPLLLLPTAIKGVGWFGPPFPPLFEFPLGQFQGTSARTFPLSLGRSDPLPPFFLPPPPVQKKNSLVFPRDTFSPSFFFFLLAWMAVNISPFLFFCRSGWKSTSLFLPLFFSKPSE